MQSLSPDYIKKVSTKVRYKEISKDHIKIWLVTSLVKDLPTSDCQVEGQLIHQLFFRPSVLNFMKLVFPPGEESNL